MAGAPGFEPGNAGTKNRCLTAWLRPNKSNRSNRLRGLITASKLERNLLIAKSHSGLQVCKKRFQPLMTAAGDVKQTGDLRRASKLLLPKENWVLGVRYAVSADLISRECRLVRHRSLSA